ncbi:polysaccharide export protein [Brevundimonas sp. BR2-1]|uniref:polysaccharide biosynthesis/export family protein n=1 Tax=Brevundimonas sp. BR2-1 TaxID=3031123 RepID=UPI0030ADB03B
MRNSLVIFLAMTLTACGSAGRSGSTSGATNLIDPIALQAASPNHTGEDYIIGPTDKLIINVFQVADLSSDDIRVDAAGNIQMPLIGSVPAAGRSPSQLSQDIQGRLGARYLRNPQVTVTVAEAASQKVTVDGAVTEPGVYLMRGRTTLLQAVAMAKGASRVADLESVAVFRTVADRRMVAVFDLASIRSGNAVDPVLQGDDVVVVDTSRLSATMRDVVAALPGLAAFAYF